MSDQVGERSSPGATHHYWLLALAAVAVVVGVVVRFKGLGTWPFGSDEYYFAQSVENILRAGLPEYGCGGYYERGLLLQYLAAGLRLLGLSAELAPRFIAAVSSLIALPAIYLLGRRVHGVPVGLLAVVLLSLSVWEVEMARFGRMYAPFQAVFLWHLVYFLRYTVDRQSQALRGMVLLAFLGVLVWEGGVLQIALNLLPPFINHERGRLSWAQWRYLGLMGLLMLPIYLFWSRTAPLRTATEVPALPPDFAEIVAGAQPDVATGPLSLWHAFADQSAMWALALIPLALAGWALPWLLSFRHRRLAAAGLLVALAAAFAHQLLVFLAALALLLLTRLVDWRELLGRGGAWRFHAAVVAATAGWILVGVFTESWRDATAQSISSTAAVFAQELFGFPNALEMIARPWARAVPWLGLSILLLLGVSAVRAIVRKDGAPVEQALLIVAVIMVLLVGVAGAPRITTRYTFFLYPLFLVIAITVWVRGAELIRWRKIGAPLLGPAVALGWFATTEDFQPRHLLHVDSAEINFRIGMSRGRATHYYGRSNARATADWLRAHADNSTDLVISGPGVTALTYYYPGIDFVYVDPSDQRLAAWSCQLGTVERWSNLPLVYRMATLQERISASPRSYIVVAAPRAEWLMAKLREFSPRVVWVNAYGSDVVVLIERAGRA